MTTDHDDTGSVFPVPDESELPERIQGLFGKAREALGFVPNVFRVWSYRPERLSAWFGHFRLLHEPTEGLTAAARGVRALPRAARADRGADGRRSRDGRGRRLAVQRLSLLPRRARPGAARGA